MDCRMYGLYGCATGQPRANDSLTQSAFFYHYYISYMQTYSITKENVPKWKTSVPISNSEKNKEKICVRSKKLL